MLYSMTGYGRAEQTFNDKTYLVEIRSLNGKQLDIRLNIPALLKPFEFEVRNLITEKIIRGSVECTISLKYNGAIKPVSINTDLAKAYYEPLATMSKELGLDSSQILSALLKLPEVVTPSTEILTASDWQNAESVLLSAIDQLTQHRAEEGRVTEADLVLRIENIASAQQKVAEMEQYRKEKIKQDLVKLLEENIGKGKYDANRMEQELIYYIEKIDISEEMLRLSNHCQYFKDILNEKEMSKGKKLSFILQEMGREINTTGSKSYDATLQKLVVEMKDELEKAKEQVLNIL